MNYEPDTICRYAFEGHMEDDGWHPAESHLARIIKPWGRFETAYRDGQWIRMPLMCQIELIATRQVKNVATETLSEVDPVEIVRFRERAKKSMVSRT